MNCKQTRKWMSPYLDSELGATKTFEVGEHLRQCPACKGRFDGERRVDALIRGRLERETMPAEMWSRISRNVSMPFWLRSLRRPIGIAMAACLVLALTGGVVFWPRSAPDPHAWIVGRLEVLTPDNQPFAGAWTEQAVLEQKLHDTFGIEFVMASPKPSAVRHDVQLVSAKTRVDAAGREYTELRLNCCGEPVLMVLARRNRGSPLPEPFEGVLFDADGVVAQLDGANVASRDLGGTVALVASQHPIEQIVTSLRVVKA